MKTRRINAGGLRIARPPRGAHARLWRRLRAELPVLDEARVHVDMGGMLQVEVERDAGDPAARFAAVTAAGEHLGVEVQSMVDARQPRAVTHWIAAQVDGRWVIVSTKVCECHDGLPATLGVFPDQDDVIAHHTGRALRQMVPAQHHGLVGQVEVLLDTARIVDGGP